ncbi:MAG: metalloregulator ArsR/SmtB family transcription factor, partial [Pseudohongiellaceae bacterium]
MNISKLKARQLPVLDNPEVLTLLCKALADSLRLEILRLLRNESFGVMEICHILDIRQSALSHHLKILATAGLVSTRREGNSIFYRRPLLTDDDSLKQFKQQVFETVDRLPLGTRVLQQMKVIQRERSQLSLDFFNRNADKFREKQGLVTEYSQYAGSLQDLIGGLGLADESSVLEVGPGEGELLLRLAQSFRKLIALDNSSEMLERARGTIRGAKLNHVRFIHGDTRTAIRQGVHSVLIVF